MNHIDLNPFNQAPVSIGGKILGILATPFLKWFDQIVEALNRPTITQTMTFPLTPSGSSSANSITFPKNTFKSTDSIVLTAPIPVAGTSFSAYYDPATANIVWVYFDNFSGGPLNFPLPQDFTVTILRN